MRMAENDQGQDTALNFPHAACKQDSSSLDWFYLAPMRSKAFSTDGQRSLLRRPRPHPRLAFSKPPGEIFDIYLSSRS